MKRKGTSSKDDGQFYGLLYDIVFKAVFGHKKNTRLLTILLNALLELEGNKKIKSLTIQNPFSYQQFKGDKASVIDIKALDSSDQQYCVEVQMRSHTALMERVVYYASSRYVSQIKKGDAYQNLKKTVSLWILQEQFLPDSEKAIHNCYTLHNERNHHKLTDLMEFHFIELHKFCENVALKSSFERWLHVLKFGERYENLENLPKELLQEEGVMEALVNMKEVNSSEKARETIFLRNMYLSDIATIELELAEKRQLLEEERRLREEEHRRLEEEHRRLEEEHRRLEEERQLREEERQLLEEAEKKVAEECQLREEERQLREEERQLNEIKLAEERQLRESLEKELAALKKKMGA